MFRPFRSRAGASLLIPLISLLACPLSSSRLNAQTVASQSAREIPIAYRVDVLVVGGSSHGVAAAESAARRGASVFLAAPRSYLGEDLVDTLRLELPEGEEPTHPLLRRIYRETQTRIAGPGIPYTYTTDRPTTGRHRDTDPPTHLADGLFENAVRHSIEYRGDVTVTVDLGSPQAVTALSLFAFEKPKDYGVDRVRAETSLDGENFTAIGEVDTPDRTPTGQPWSRIRLDLPVGQSARYLKVHVSLPTECKRLLLGELVVEGKPTRDAVSPTGSGPRYRTTPYRIKTELDRWLLDADVQYLFGCYATDVLVDAEGRVAGIVMANRAGRQAVIAKTVIDATPRAAVAELAGADSTPWPGTPVVFHRTTLEQGRGGEVICRDHAIPLTLPDATFPSFAEAEQTARDQTFQPDDLRTSAFLHYVPPDAIRCRKTALETPSTGPIDLDHFRPRGIERLFVLSGRADLRRDVAADLLAPGGLIPTAQRIGRAAARVVVDVPMPTAPRVRAGRDATSSPGDIREVLQGVRSTSATTETVHSPAQSLPVLGRYDVVVIGGGTAGAAAGIGAARQGARTLVAEYQEGLGGVGTLGMIGKAYHGQAVGFGGEVPFPNKDFSIEQKMEWYRRQLRSAGADIWLGVLGCGAYVDDGRVLGAVIATPQGRGVVLAEVVIDATGNADIAVAAGAKSTYGANAREIALQGTGLPTRSLHDYYTNSDYLLVDESDMLDVWRALVGAKQTMSETTFDAGSLIQTRERRRVVGDHQLRYLDQIAGRTYPDTIVYSGSDYDSHGYPNHAYFALLPHDEKSRAANHPAPGGTCYTPYRALLPQGIDRLLVVGLGISMDRDASAMVRMQRDISNQGYAAGVAAAMVAQEGIATRALDVRRLQRHLVQTGALPEEVLTHEDSFPLSAERVETAVRELPKATNPRTAAVPLAVILSHQEQAMPVLWSAHAAAADADRLVYARVLGMLGDPTGVDELIEALDAVTTWDEKIFQGNAAEYAHLPTPVDSLILALGSCGDDRALEPILAKLDMLDAGVTLSHHRAVALALERLGDTRAARPLAALLRKPGMRGHVMHALEPLHNQQRDKRRRTGPLREIVLARALYHLGDHESLGESILKEYTTDVRGLFARHAQAVLAAGEDSVGPTPE